MSATFSVSKTNGRIDVHVEYPVEDNAAKVSRLQEHDVSFTDACSAAMYLRRFGFPVNQAYVDAVQDSAAPTAKVEAEKPSPLKKPGKKTTTIAIPHAYLQNASKAFAKPISDVKGLGADTRATQTHLDSLRQKGVIRSTLGPAGVDARFGPYTLAAYNEAAALVRKTNPNAKDSQIPGLIAQLDTQSKAPVVVAPTGGAGVIGNKKPIVIPAHP